MVYQDPYDSINPRMTILDIINEPLEIHNINTKKERRQKVIDTLRMVKLEPAEEISKKYPHMLSGGQRQRVVIARAIIVKPEIIIADEPVSMLDVSIRAEILELMKEIQLKNKISMIYITHDLATGETFCRLYCNFKFRKSYGIRFNKQGFNKSRKYVYKISNCCNFRTRS